MKKLDITLRHDIAETKVDILKWVAGLLLARAAVIAALVKLSSTTASPIVIAPGAGGTANSVLLPKRDISAFGVAPLYRIVAAVKYLPDRSWRRANSLSVLFSMRRLNL